MGPQPVAERVVWLLRHAKAAPHGPDDHERPLTGKGRRQSEAVERFVEGASLGVVKPQLVLSSSAARALETAELVQPAVAGADLVVEPRLYDADLDDVVDVLRELPDHVTSVMVVGHNPTFHDLALELLGPSDTDGRDRLERGFPTAALAVIGVRAPRWAELVPGTGRLVELFTPGT